MEKQIQNKFKNLYKLIGNTPLIEIGYHHKGKSGKVYTKLESYNLTGSIKDRAALEMLKSAYENDKLKLGQTICETTSGNMGISLCAIANILGNPVVICMPKTMSAERQKLIGLFGARLELTDNFEEAFKKAEEYGKNGAFLSHQFDNYDNLLSHYKTTASEICKKLKNVDCFVSGVGTGGTLIGVGKRLKEKYNTKVIAIEPQESSLLTNGYSTGKHKIQGLSDEIIPRLYDQNIVDRIIPIRSDDAIAMARAICTSLGISVGISSGANFLGCVLNGQNKAVTIFADDNKKYLSTDLAKNITSPLVEAIHLTDFKVL